MDTWVPVAPDHIFLLLWDACPSRKMLSGCASGKKHNKLIYAARYSGSDHKGQYRFLKSVPAGLLEGFTVQFFGAGPRSQVQKDIEAVAMERNISVEVNGKVTQHTLMRKVCHSKGSIIFSCSDANPRVAYEGLPAGNPVFASAQTNLPRVMLEQPFVFHDDWENGAQEGMPGFRAFMDMIRQLNAESHERIAEISNRHLLDHGSVYKGAIEKLGLNRAAEYKRSGSKHHR